MSVKKIDCGVEAETCLSPISIKNLKKQKSEQIKNHGTIETAGTAETAGTIGTIGTSIYRESQHEVPEAT